MCREELLQELIASRDQIALHAQDSEAQLDKRYGPQKWSRRQILAHLADVEMINAWRFLRALAEPNSTVEDFDEGAWAERLDYGKRPGRVSGDLFVGARNIVIYHLGQVPEDVLAGTSNHREKGPMTGWQWARLIQDHGTHHLSQLTAARDGTEWIPPQLGEHSWKFLGRKSS